MYSSAHTIFFALAMLTSVVQSTPIQFTPLQSSIDIDSGIDDELQKHIIGGKDANTNDYPYFGKQKARRFVPTKNFNKFDDNS